MMDKKEEQGVAAYMNGNGDMVTIAELQDTAFIVENCLKATASILEAFYDSVIYKLDFDQQTLLNFITDTLRMNGEKLNTVIPDRPDQDIAFIPRNADD